MPPASIFVQSKTEMRTFHEMPAKSRCGLTLHPVEHTHCTGASQQIWQRTEPMTPSRSVSRLAISCLCSHGTCPPWGRTAPRLLQAARPPFSPGLRPSKLARLELAHLELAHLQLVPQSLRARGACPWRWIRLGRAPLVTEIQRQRTMTQRGAALAPRRWTRSKSRK